MECLLPGTQYCFPYHFHRRIYPSQFKINLYSTFNLIILVNLSPISLLKTMNIVIAGVGSVGTHLARMLSRQEHNIMLIDTNQEKLEELESQIDVLYIVGSCTSIGALKDAEVGKCDLYIAVNPLEEQNINSAILAKIRSQANHCPCQQQRISGNRKCRIPAFYRN